MIFEKYKPLILGLWALFSFSVYSGNIYAKQTENTTVPQPVQNATVKGVVKDATGEPLIGVSVVVKGTTNDNYFIQQFTIFFHSNCMERSISCLHLYFIITNI